MRHLKKTISLLLCAMLLIAMIPMAAITTQAADTITVYFTDNADFGTPNVHYWGDGETAWPGNAMTYSETNDFGQNVYKATVPANITGIIFNGNNKQTVDITSGIANNVQWYTDGTQDGKYKVVAIQHEGSDPIEPTAAPEQPTSAPVNLPNHFYVDLTAVTGGGTHWFAWTWNEGEEGQWRQIEKFGYVAAASKVLFASFNSDIPSWDTCLAQTVDFTVENGGHLTILSEKENDKFKGTWATVEPTSAPVTPTSAPEQPTTAPQPSGNITVYFTDNADFGTPNVYYWEGDAEWPGTAMTYSETNDFGQNVYKATIPANVPGIIFNGDGKQAVDITSGIANNVQWYTDGTQDGQYKVVAIQHEGTEPVQPTSAPVTPTSAPEQPTTAPQPGAAGYYLVGTMTNWAINGNKLTKNDSAPLDEYMITATLAANDGIKVVYSEDGATIKTWFPDGMDNEYVITAAGTYDIYFRPNYDGTEDWASGCLYVAASETPVQPTTAPVQPTEAPEQPTTAPVQPTSSSSEITIKFTDALGWGQIGVYYWNGEDDYLSDNGWPGDEMAKAEINEYGQQVYTATIPRNPDGLIFTEYYGDRQTIDITDGIVDGAQWYSIDELIDGAYNVGYVAPVQPTEAPVTPTSAPEQPTTAPQPSGNITVFFTDNADFGTPNIYYWDGGAEWPGTAMTFSETNDFGQNVYKATIPANVTGIIFNGNNKQTVDITSGITDYIQWYTTDTQDGKYAVASYQRPIPAQPTEAPVQPTEAPVQPTDPPVQPTDPPVQPTEAPQPAEGPVITTQPANWEGTDGQTATFTVAAEGDGLSYQWFYRSAGKVNWVAVAGGTTDTYSIAMSKARNGREVYVKVTDANGNSVSSDIVTMAYGVPVGPVITTQPQNWYGQNGSNAIFTVAAEGDGLTYQWFYKRAGMAKFAVAQGETTATYMVPMSAKNDGRTVFCVVTDQDGNSVNSNEATMSYPSITITQQPQNWFGQDGDQVSISVTAEGEGLSYQWFYYKPEKAKWIAAADTDAVYDSITMSAKFDNRQVYCQITNAEGFSVNSDIATITYSATPITITAQPQNWYGQDGAQVSISVTAEGEGLTYQWFYWKAEKNKWIAAADTDSVYDSITMASKFAGREVFCKITDQNGNTINSDSATINYPIGG